MGHSDILAQMQVEDPAQCETRREYAYRTVNTGNTSCNDQWSVWGFYRPGGTGSLKSLASPTPVLGAFDKLSG